MLQFTELQLQILRRLYRRCRWVVTKVWVVIIQGVVMLGKKGLHGRLALAYNDSEGRLLADCSLGKWGKEP